MAIMDPYRDFRFRIEIKGIQVASFSEATVPSMDTDVIEYREGTDPLYVRKLSGLTKFGNLTLKKGMTTSLELYSWYILIAEQGANTTNGRRNITLTLQDESGSDQAVWNIFNAWPSKYESSGFNAKSNDVVIETLELTLESMQRVK